MTTTTTAPLWKQCAYIGGIVLAGAVIGIGAGVYQSHQPEPVAIEAKAPARKLTKDEQEITRIQEEGRKADERASAWQAVLFSRNLDRFLASAGVHQISIEKRIGLASRMDKSLKQTGEDCSTSPATVANATAHNFPGSDNMALTMWLIDICDFRQMYGG